jgi:hypothetical protein
MVRETGVSMAYSVQVPTRLRGEETDSAASNGRPGVLPSSGFSWG